MKKIIDIIGVVVLFKFIRKIFVDLDRKTNTKLMDDSMWEKLEDRGNLKILHKEIRHYHKTGKWRKFKLK